MLELKKWIDDKHRFFDAMVKKYNPDNPNFNPETGLTCEEHKSVITEIQNMYTKDKRILTSIENHLKESGAIK